MNHDTKGQAIDSCAAVVLLALCLGALGLAMLGLFVVLACVARHIPFVF